MSQTVTALLMGEFCIRDNSFCLIYDRHVTTRMDRDLKYSFGSEKNCHIFGSDDARL